LSGNKCEMIAEKQERKERGSNIHGTEVGNGIYCR